MRKPSLPRLRVAELAQAKKSNKMGFLIKGQRLALIDLDAHWLTVCRIWPGVLIGPCLALGMGRNVGEAKVQKTVVW